MSVRPIGNRLHQLDHAESVRVVTHTEELGLRAPGLCARGALADPMGSV